MKAIRWISFILIVVVYWINQFFLSWSEYDRIISLLEIIFKFTVILITFTIGFLINSILVKKHGKNWGIVLLQKLSRVKIVGWFQIYVLTILIFSILYIGFGGNFYCANIQNEEEYLNIHNSFANDFRNYFFSVVTDIPYDASNFSKEAISELYGDSDYSNGSFGYLSYKEHYASKNIDVRRLEISDDELIVDVEYKKAFLYHTNDIFNYSTNKREVDTLLKTDYKIHFEDNQYNFYKKRNDFYFEDPDKNYKLSFNEVLRDSYSIIRLKFDMQYLRRNNYFSYGVPTLVLKDVESVGALSFDKYDLIFIELFNRYGKVDTSEELKFDMPSKMYKKLYYLVNAQDNIITPETNSIIRMLYFSAITIGTLGFGDIVPLSNSGRILVMLETIAGIVIMGLAVNSLVVTFNNGIKEN